MTLFLEKRASYLVTLAAVFVHGLALAWMAWGDRNLDAHAFDSLDAREYHGIALNLVRHGAFSQPATGQPVYRRLADETPPLAPDTWRTPGYPFFLAVIMSVVGPSPSRLIFAQHVLGVFNVVLFFRIASTAMTRRRAALAALLFLFEPYRVYYAFWLLSTTWFQTLLLLTWRAWQRWKISPRCGWAAVLGLLASMLILIWPLAVLIPLVILVGIVWTAARCSYAPIGSEEGKPIVGTSDSDLGAGRRPRTAFLTISGFFLIALALPLALWMGRNHRVAGHFGLSHQSGIVLAYFKATEVVLWREGKTTDRYIETSLDSRNADASHKVWERIDDALRSRFSHLPVEQCAQLHWRNLAQGNKTSINDFEVSGELGKIGWSYLLESPIGTTTCCLARIFENLIFPLNLALGQYSGVPPQSRVRQGLIGAVFLALMLWWVCRLFRRRLPWSAVYFPFASTVALFLVAAPQVDPRFRVPVVPLLLFVCFIPALSRMNRS